MIFRRYGNFAGGIQLPEEKQATQDLPIRQCPIPQRLRVPLTYCAARPAEPLVEVGASVKASGKIAAAADAGSMHIFAPLSGRVAGLTVVSVAGPASNFVLGILFALLLRTLLLLPVDLSGRYAAGLLDMVIWGAMINFLLGIFNLLPIAPLDGHHILRELLPYGARERFMQFSRFGPLIIIALFIFGGGVFRLMWTPAVILIELISGVEI